MRVQSVRLNLTRALCMINHTLITLFICVISDFIEILYIYYTYKTTNIICRFIYLLPY